MKKSVVCLAALLVCILCTGCKKSPQIALITDSGTVSDGSFNESAWDGVVAYGLEHEINYAYYQPKKPEKAEYLKSIKKAIKKGAKIIVCSGHLHETSIFEAQKMYPGTHFILVDGTVHNEDYTDYSIGENVMPIHFNEEQAGFLAGYAAVRDGYTRLGFMGGEMEEGVIRFGYGFVQGADYAAIETGNQIEVKYAYSGTFEESEAVHNLVCGWYESGTEVIFAAGNAMGRSVMRAAEHYEHAKVIGVDIDQSSVSGDVITSAVKQFGNAVYQGIDDHYNDRFNGGMVTYMNAANDGIGLVMENSRFRKFTKEDYARIYAKLSDGSIQPYAQTNIGTTEELMTVNMTIDYQTMPQE